MRSPIQSEVKRMIQKVWLRLLMFLMFCVAFVAVTPALMATSANDEQCPPSIARESYASETACDFDGIEMQTADTAAPTLGSLTPSQANLIQAFADRFGAEVNVVGSQAAGTAGPLSDFDYVIGGNASLRNSASYYLPRGAAGGEINASGFETGIDILNANRTPLDPTRPFIQFTPGQPPVVGPH